MTYTFAIENGSENLPELFPLYATHYREMQERLAGEGVQIGDFAPRVDEYIRQWESGSLINYTVRLDGKPVGYSNVYVTQDMHNGETIAQEDTIYVLKEHRNGIGRKLAQFVIADLAQRGVKRLHITAVTDVRATKLWERMGFKNVASSMIYRF